MDEEYDVIVLGTGLKECVLSGLMSSVLGKKVLHLDRNSYYGGESASLNLKQLYQKFRGKDSEPNEELGQSRNYCVDLCPKFLLACGTLVKILLKTNVTHYLEFRSVAGSYVLQGKKIRKVPSDPKEATTSSLLSLTQKNKFRTFLTFVGNYVPDDEKTHKNRDLSKMTADELMDIYKLSDKVKTFTGHAICLYLDDSYREGPALDMVLRAQLYANSVARYGNSPYIYPKWGLGGLPEGFARRCAVHGGIYMLNSDNVDNFIEEITYDDDGRVTGLKVNKMTATLKKDGFIIGDPSYWVDTKKIKSERKIIRAICIMDHPIDNTKNSDSCQIILPASECNRQSDIYICMSSYEHNIADKGKYIAVCSANFEAEDEDDTKSDLAPALEIIGDCIDTFVWVSDYYEPENNPEEDGCYITSSYDATTHFQTSIKEVLDIYEKIAGEPISFDESGEGDDEKGE